MRVLMPLALMVALWQAAVLLSQLPPFILPAPGAVLVEAWTSRALLATHGLVTLAEVLAGLAIGTAFGAATAIALHLAPPLRRIADPLLAASQALPVFVLAPVLTIWLGYGMGPKIAMTVLLVFFPVLSGLVDAMDAVPDAHLDLARIARASRLRTVLLLGLPHAAGGLRSGLRIAATYAPTGAVIGEWIGASKGLGYLMLMANARSRAELMFAALAVIVAFTLALRGAVGLWPAPGGQSPESRPIRAGTSAKSRATASGRADSSAAPP
ncbi:ABC transporter permease [Gemmobacter straminiformis]|uniref:ABC transporter permease n=1 Tax=Paragemmobacter straminiformis TaxID=2045119 RepID=A0A842ICC9_9RHOB|nr:ABC transporter permease [Gemmobacter straminiformis]